MGRTQDEVIATLPPARQKAIQRRAEELITEERSLRELRKKLDLTQPEVAHRLKKGQEVVSWIEQRQDLPLSTLQGYVESLGGELELVCRFQDREAVRLRPAAVKAAAAKPAGKRASRRRMAVA